MDRKAMKAGAKRTFARHYWLAVAACLIAALMGVEYATSLWAVEGRVPELDAAHLESMIDDMAAGEQDAVRAEVERNERRIHDNDTNEALARSRGVFATVLNSLSSGRFLLTFTDAANSILRSENAAIPLLVAASFVLYVFVWLFVQQTYRIVLRRIMLEARLYGKVPWRRFLYPFQTRCWPRMAWTMFVTSAYLALWSLTIVGGIVKLYSYALVPYIMAENPTIGANRAISLSRRMMRGHKWQWFVTQLSFLGWQVLNLLTFGLVGILYLNGYRAAFYAEYYAALRADAKAAGIEGADALCDEALFVKPTPAQTARVYQDAVHVIRDVHDDEPAARPTGLTGVLSEWFGVTLRRDEAVEAWQRHEARLAAIRDEQDVIRQRTYPERMAPAPMRFKAQTVSGPGATRTYTLLNLVMMFFIFCCVGWVWEVAVAFITEGAFVNRGTLHGPWLPIYGTGGVAILLALRKLRTRPVLEFLATIVLCGTLEYCASVLLETMHDGQRWWDYTGYFLNLDGRICAEGLLTFGVGGLAVVYLLAPALDDLLSRVNTRVLTAAAVTLVLLFCCDQIYSVFVPNAGPGVTDYRAAAAQETAAPSAEAVSTTD